MPSTERLYWQDAYRREFSATALSVDADWCALSATTFYPGGGGQPPDTGRLLSERGEASVDLVRSDGGLVWHHAAPALIEGLTIAGRVDWPRRYQLMKYHTLLHIVNTLMFDRYNALITGVDIGEAQARIDFAVEASLRNETAALEDAINETIGRALALSSSFVTEAEFHRTPRLVRTLDVRPPIENGRVRTLEIVGFDVQACGGTHVHTTAELGRCQIARVDNKGKRNKRLYLILESNEG